MFSRPSRLLILFSIQKPHKKTKPKLLRSKKKSRKKKKKKRYINEKYFQVSDVREKAKTLFAMGLNLEKMIPGYKPVVSEEENMRGRAQTEQV